MLVDDLPKDLVSRVTPRALRAYALGLGLRQLDGVNSKILVYHRADDRAVQLVIPLDARLDDYADMVLHAVLRLAEFDKRPSIEILDHLLLPPADLLQFRDTSIDARDGSLPLDQAVNFVSAIR